MESTAFFEKKISLKPSDFNEVKKTNIDTLLEKRAKDQLENKCSEHGFVLPGSVKLLSRSMGYFEAARFTGDAIYYLKLEGKVIYPADGIRVVGEVIRKNKMGLYVEYRKAIRIQVPRDLHLGNEDYDAVEIGDTVEIELKRSKFQINDPYILASGIYISTKSGESIPSTISKENPSEESKVEAEEGEEKLPEEMEEEDDEEGGEYDEEEEEDEDEEE